MRPNNELVYALLHLEIRYPQNHGEKESHTAAAIFLCRVARHKTITRAEKKKKPTMLTTQAHWNNPISTGS